MASPGGTGSPRKPWEGGRSSTAGPSIFRPASGATSTAAVVESAAVCDPPEKAGPMSTGARAQNGVMVSRPPMPVLDYNGTGYPTSSYNQYSGYGSNAYTTNSSYGAYNTYNRGYGYGGVMHGGSYGLGSSYGGSYGGSLYGNNYGGGMYGGGLYGNSQGGGMGMGMGGAGPLLNRPGDPNNPHEYNHPARPPNYWQNMLSKMHWVVVVFGHVASLVSENTHSFYLLSTALYQLFEQSGMLYGELARIVLRILSWWSSPKRRLPKSALSSSPGLKNPVTAQQTSCPKGATGSWENVWVGDGM